MPAKNPARGPLSAATQQRIRDMAGRGLSIQGIAADIGRSDQVVARVLTGIMGESRSTGGTRAAKTRTAGPRKNDKVVKAKSGAKSDKATPNQSRNSGLGDKPVQMTKTAKPINKAEPQVEKPVRMAKQPATQKFKAQRSAAALLEHRFWLREGLSVKLTLPRDLNTDEAERLAVLVRTLPFSN